MRTFVVSDVYVWIHLAANAVIHHTAEIHTSHHSFKIHPSERAPVFFSFSWREMIVHLNVGNPNFHYDSR